MANKSNSQLKSRSKIPSPSQQAPISRVEKPPHYIITITNREGQTFQCEAVDIIEAVCPDNAHLGHALTYLLRLGKKGGLETVMEDLGKARWWVNRRIEFLKRHGHQEVK